MVARPASRARLAWCDQRAQRLGDLGRPERVGVDLARAVEITAEVLATQLMGQRADLGGVVELVAVVHQDRPGEVGQDEGFEGVQVAVAEQIVRVELGAGDQQVLLGLLAARLGLFRPDPQRGLVGADRVGQGDQAADPLVHLGQQPGGAGEHAVHEPRARGGAGQRLQQLDAAVRRG